MTSMGLPIKMWHTILQDCKPLVQGKWVKTVEVSVHSIKAGAGKFVVCEASRDVWGDTQNVIEEP